MQGRPHSKDNYLYPTYSIAPSHRSLDVSIRLVHCFRDIGCRIQKATGHSQRREFKSQPLSRILQTVALYTLPLRESRMSWRRHKVPKSCCGLHSSWFDVHRSALTVCIQTHDVLKAVDYLELCIRRSEYWDKLLPVLKNHFHFESTMDIPYLDSSITKRLNVC